MPSKRLKYLISVLASAAIVLGVSHHLFNFWGLEISKEGVILLIAVPALTFLTRLLINRIWEVAATIEKKRWLLFLFPAVIAALILTWRFYAPPSTWHTLEIVPAPSHSGGQIELYEIKIPRGRAVKFSKLSGLDGWTLEGDTLKSVGANPSSISYSFFSPIGESASLLFLRSPNSRDVTMILDGKKINVELNQPDAGLTSAQMKTSYKLGIPDSAILFVVAAIDFLAFFFFILLIWLVQEIAQTIQNTEDEKFFPHRVNLIALLALALFLHTINFLAAPLIVASDSPSYLQGSVHWMQVHNLDGVTAARGPGTTFLFIPAFLLFGRNPWGVKSILHSLAVASVLVGYGLGWRLFKRRSFAFFAGLIIVLMPEMYLYLNVVLSDVPNIFFGLLFCLLLLSALETPSWKNVIACMLTASFAALTRPENVLLLAIAAGFLFVKIILDKTDILKRFAILGAALILAIIPLLGWSAHNKRVYGFFGLSNYADEVLYDGWIYFGEASGFHITDPDSPAVQSIAEVIRVYGMPAETIAAPTGWELYPLLLKYGYNESQAIKLLGDAAKDSIRKNPGLSAQIYLVKLKKSFVPETIMTITFALPEEAANAQPKKGIFFDAEENRFPLLVAWQRQVYDSLWTFDQYFYYPLILFCLGVLFLAVYQKNFFVWAPVVIVTASRLFIPITIGLGNWRYVVSGVPFLLIFSLLAIQSMRGFLSYIFNPKTG
ncbi:MAG: glycosyltransferase family 39 protein [Anaerolineales bacterium]|nr:glycosyltransferase family 39 protein [Anaerolineales bacterium]